MSMNNNKVLWCLKKAEKEIAQGKKHRGLLKIEKNEEKMSLHIKKAEHNLNAITDFQKIGYSDWSASAAFYSIYHCFLAILLKFGYESRNQECTFALINSLIEDKKISLRKDIVDEIYSMKTEEAHELPTIIEIRELEQYGISLSLEDNTLNILKTKAKLTLDLTKEIIETK